MAAQTKRHKRTAGIGSKSLFRARTKQLCIEMDARRSHPCELVSLRGPGMRGEHWQRR